MAIGDIKNSTSPFCRSSTFPHTLVIRHAKRASGGYGITASSIGSTLCRYSQGWSSPVTRCVETASLYGAARVFTSDVLDHKPGRFGPDETHMSKEHFDVVRIVETQADFDLEVRKPHSSNNMRAQALVGEVARIEKLRYDNAPLSSWVVVTHDSMILAMLHYWNAIPGDVHEIAHQDGFSLQFDPNHGLYVSTAWGGYVK